MWMWRRWWWLRERFGYKFRGIWRESEEWEIDGLVKYKRCRECGPLNCAWPSPCPHLHTSRFSCFFSHSSSYYSFWTNYFFNSIGIYIYIYMYYRSETDLKISIFFWELAKISKLLLLRFWCIIKYYWVAYIFSRKLKNKNLYVCKIFSY